MQLHSAEQKFSCTESARMPNASHKNEMAKTTLKLPHEIQRKKKY